MASVQNNNFDVRESEGTNYAQIATIVGILVGITALLVLAYWYSYLWYPRYQVLLSDNPQPLSEEYPLEAMPALPESSAILYDEHIAAQVASLDESGLADVDGDSVFVKLPIDTAIDLMIEEGLFETAGE